MKRSTAPVSGLQGDHRGTCITCIQPTDTGLAFVGEAEWILAGFHVLGIPQDQALATLADGDPRFRPVGKVPNGRVTIALRVCGDCANRAKFPVGLITAGGELPAVRQPS